MRRAVFTNNGGSVISAAAKLTVYYRPIITGPANADVVPGSVVTFSATAVADPAVSGVQWQISTDGGTNWTNVAGATTPMLTVTASLADDQDEYQVIFTNAVGSSTSAPTTLRVPTVVVAPLPPNDFPSIPVSWQDQANPTDAGGESFDVLVSTNAGAWTPWLTQTTQTAAAYAGQLGQSYAFYAQADGAMNAPPPFAETQTLTPMWQYALPSEPENTPTGTGTTIAAILQNRVSDVDPKTIPGVAVALASGNGAWQYNIGSGWLSLGNVSPTQARLLSQTARVRFLPAPGWTGAADLLFVAWDHSLGANGALASVLLAGGGAPFSVNAGEATLQVTSAGTAPTWTAATLTLPPVLPGSGPSPVQTVASMFGPVFAGSSTVGIAVVGAAGTWQYSRDGGNTWTSFGAVSARSARLLSGNDLIRAVPSRSFAGTLTLTARAWDGSGTDGDSANLATPGATGANSHFGGNLLNASLAINHAPVLPVSGVALGSDVENRTSAPIKVTTLTAGVSDPDPEARRGVAVVSATRPGAWQYLLSGGLWQTLSPIPQGSALLLPASARLRFVPAPDEMGSASLTFRAWDLTAGMSGSLDPVSTTGGASDVSSNEATATLAIIAAPTGPTWLGGSPARPSVLPFPSASTGTTVASLFGTLFADPNPNAAMGIAMVGLTGTTRGVWQYEAAGSTTWTTVTSASLKKAILLAGGDGVRFVPSKGFLGTVQLQALAWDGTGLSDTSVNLSGDGAIGVRTDFSATLATALVLVNDAPVLHT